MVAISRLSGGIAAVALGGAALIASSTTAFAQPTATINVGCDTGALVSAINTANTSIGPTTIQLSPFCNYTIFTPAAVNDGLPPIKADVTLAGAQNTVIRRSAFTPLRFRLLEVAATGDLTVRNISLMNGNPLLGNGGAILDGGQLTVANSRISGNSALNGGAVLVGSGASATFSGSLLNQNTTTSVGGGGILTFGLVRLFSTVLDSNSAPVNGGGINIQGSGNVVTEQTTITNNRSGSAGGGISNLGTLSLNGSQVRLNIAGAKGGGIVSGNNNVTIVSSIIRRNTPDNCSPVFAGCS